jgi:exosortase A-associated hydrolase 1
MTSNEIPVGFLCQRKRLYGILHRPMEARRRGVLIVQGRPANRVGKHRLFVLLARAWAAAGHPVMRFDFRGTGDSEGELMTIEETSDDVASAVDAFTSNLPGLQEIVLWGLCGGAADALLYAPKDPRVVAAALINPWIYDARLRTLVKWRRQGSVYLQGVLNKYRRDAVRDEGTAENVHTALGGEASAMANSGTPAAMRAYASYRAPDISKRLARSMEEFKGQVMLILGGGDVGAQTFNYTTSISLRWRRLLSAERVRIHNLPGANHSLRRPEWREQASALTLGWLNQL